MNNREAKVLLVVAFMAISSALVFTTCGTKSGESPEVSTPVAPKMELPIKKSIQNKPKPAEEKSKPKEDKVKGIEQKTGSVKVAMTADVNQDLVATRKRMAELEKRIKERREGTENIN